MSYTDLIDEQVKIIFPEDSDSLNAAQKAYKMLKLAILRNELPVNEPIPQTRLSESLGVSRTPLREAINRLERENLIVVEKNKRFIVPSYTAVDVDQHIAMRIALEALAVRITVPLLTAEDIRELERCIEDIKSGLSSDDNVILSRSHRRFHFIICSKTGRMLSSTIKMLQEQSMRYQLIYRKGHRFDFDRHQSVFDAVKAGDAEKAVEELVIHYRQTFRSVIESLDPNYKIQAINKILV